jgi:hypothetical protein
MEGIAIAVDDCIAHPFSPFSTLTSFYKDFFFVSMFMFSALVFRLIWVLFDFGNGYWIWRYFDGRFQGDLVWSVFMGYGFMALSFSFSFVVYRRLLEKVKDG